MAFFDADGWLQAEPSKGDTFAVRLAPRPKDYGALSVAAPVLIVHHTTARWMPDDELTPPYGMKEYGARVLKKPEYANAYVLRDGNAIQVARFGRGCIGCGGHVIVGGKSVQINLAAFQIEWDNWGWADPKGGRGGSAKVAPSRHDAVYNTPDNPYKSPPAVQWQNIPVAQARTVAAICAAAVVASKGAMRALDALHGHLEIGRGSHADPGPQVCLALEKVVAPWLGLPADTIAPARLITRPIPVVISALEVS